MVLCGGWSEIRQPNDTVHSIVSQLKNELEEKAGRQFEQLTALQFRSQVVNGTNYLIKVRFRKIIVENLVCFFLFI